VSPVVEVVHSVDAKPATCRDRVEDVREVVDGMLRRPAVIACFDVVVLANVVLVLCMVCVRSTLVCMVSCTVLVRGISVLCCAWFLAALPPAWSARLLAGWRKCASCLLLLPQLVIDNKQDSALKALNIAQLVTFCVFAVRCCFVARADS
jgi:ABC-type uncharacterized transport system permease subunit